MYSYSYTSGYCVLAGVERRFSSPQRTRVGGLEAPRDVDYVYYDHIINHVVTS